MNVENCVDKFGFLSFEKFSPLLLIEAWVVFVLVEEADQ